MAAAPQPGNAQGRAQPLEFFVHSREKGLEVCRTGDGQPEVTRTDVASDVSEDISLTFSRDSSTMLYYTTEGDLVATDVRTGQVIRSIHDPKMQEITISPKGTYGCTFRREDSDNPNLHVYNLQTGEEVASFIQRRWPALTWSPDESVCLRELQARVYVVPGDNLLADPMGEVEGRIATVSVSTSTPAVAAILTTPPRDAPPETNGAIQVFRLPNLQKVVMNQQFPAVEEAEMTWNSPGNHLLIQAKTSADHTGRSYYGISLLFMLAVTAKKFWQVSLGAGQLHDVRWAPNGQQFIVISGEMPNNRATLFDTKGQIVYEFPTCPRNKVLWSPHNRFVMIGGFGNLSSGEMDIWDLQRKTPGGTLFRVAQMAHQSCSSVAWSPDSRYLLSSVCWERMKVDNRVVVWKHNGVILWKGDFAEALHSVVWKPAPAKSFPQRDPSPPPAGHTMQSVVKKPVQVYRPQHGSSTVTAALERARGAASGGGAPRGYALRAVAKPGFGESLGAFRGLQSPAEEAQQNYIPGMSPAILKAQQEAQKKAAKKKAKEDKANQPKKAPKAPPKAASAASPATGAAADTDGAPTATPAEAKAKKIKNLEKKIKEIEQLQKKDTAALDTNQRKKINQLPRFQKELADVIAQEDE